MDIIESETENQENSEEDTVTSDDKSDCLSEIFEENEMWRYMPDSILLNIFQYLTPKELTIAGEVCKSWHRVSYDEFLWKDLFHRAYGIEPNVGIMPGKNSWLGEFKRLTYHVPLIETEVLTKHSHQVLHVSFSHNGKMFATCSKDGYIFVWESQYPVRIKYRQNMESFRWEYTQFSQFNSSDSLLLVSGARFETPHSTSGEIAVFSLTCGFDLQCRVANNPYDIFGTWYSEHYLLSGSLHWLAHSVSTSILWLNKANQELSSENIPIITQLFRFCNGNSSSVRAVMVANCLTPDQNESKEQEGGQPSSNMKENPLSHTDISSTSSDCSNETIQHQKEEKKSGLQCNTLEGISMNWTKLDNCFQHICPLQYNQEYNSQITNSFRIENTQQDKESEQSVNTKEDNVDEIANSCDKYLIFTTGSETYIPHQIAFKRIKDLKFPTSIYPGPDKFDKIDHVIDLHGHIVGMGLSPDHRYLYVNIRPWLKDYVITNPLQPPPIAKEIDIHVIDLVTLEQVGFMSRAHRAYTSSNKCFFIFLDVCDEYVASGAEDKYGYLWDRYYGMCLAKLPHSDVVNSVAFNPCDPEMLITTSDDYTIKIWRSRAKVRALSLNENSYPRGIEVQSRHKHRRTYSTDRLNNSDC
ncbi:F-box/WD repeat-containing protein 5 [Dufourea novaeangliae]|uniref:F-box/WD repeat-containing protein 5 n=1 Tax=Dufourea novaeangliae TaxID=178035 RepID=A0A154PNZ8_DUFNO|nr:F-box/WD repeat-containing protein 5 [Dufourea novaeangliae]